jgi:plasmid stability protein
VRPGDIIKYHQEGIVADILIRNLPDELIAAIDARAKRVGLSRVEYLRRTLERERGGGAGPVTTAHLQRLSSLAADLDDPDVMSGAWS